MSGEITALWPPEMEDVFHRVSFIASNMDEDERWVFHGDALAIADVNAMVAFMRTVRAEVLSKRKAA